MIVSVITNTVAAITDILENFRMLRHTFANAEERRVCAIIRQLPQYKRRRNQVRAIVEAEVNGRLLRNWHFPNQLARGNASEPPGRFHGVHNANLSLVALFNYRNIRKLYKTFLTVRQGHGYLPSLPVQHTQQ